MGVINFMAFVHTPFHRRVHCVYRPKWKYVSKFKIHICVLWWWIHILFKRQQHVHFSMVIISQILVIYHFNMVCSVSLSCSVCLHINHGKMSTEHTSNFISIRMNVRFKWHKHNAILYCKNSFRIFIQINCFQALCMSSVFCKTIQILFKNTLGGNKPRNKFTRKHTNTLTLTITHTTKNRQTSTHKASDRRKQTQLR